MPERVGPNDFLNIIF